VEGVYTPFRQCFGIVVFLGECIFAGEMVFATGRAGLLWCVFVHAEGQLHLRFESHLFLDLFASTRPGRAVVIQSERCC
jgi:hypothetical protein